jgi:hypothetical protein
LAAASAAVATLTAWREAAMRIPVIERATFMFIVWSF